MNKNNIYGASAFGRHAYPFKVRNLFIISVATVFYTLLLTSPTQAQAADTVHHVNATVETTPVSHSGDAADDSAVWVHPTNTGLSLVIGTDKQGGIMLYNLSGTQLNYTPFGNINNIDIRYGFNLADVPTPIIAASNRSNNTIGVYQINPLNNTISSIAARSITTDMTVYGFCMYRSAESGKYYGFVNSQTGVVKQYEFFDNAGKVDATLVRTFDVGSQVEGCVADDELGYFYVGEEEVGIWKYGAEPTDGTSRVLVDSTSGHLDADVEGLTLYKGANGTGYLIASSQGNNTYVAYERSGANAYAATFDIVSGSSIDGTSDTDGIKVYSFGMGNQFSNGVFIAQDGKNTGGRQNFKLVPWESIAVPAGLIIDTDQDPRIVVGGPATTTPPSEENAPVPPPTSVTATAISTNQINLQWVNNAGNLATTKVERSQNNSSYTTVATLGGGVSNYSNLGLSTSTLYYYRLTSIANTGSSSLPSTVVSTSTLAGVVVTPPTPPAVTTYAFPVSEDATVFAASPQTNYGLASSLEVDSSPSSQAFLKFQATGVQGTVKSAVVRIYVTNASANGPAIYAAGNNWTETDVNFNNKPASIGSALANKAKTSTGWQEYSVTSAVTGNGTYTFLLSPDSTDGLDFTARTGTNSSRLIIITE